MVQILRGLGLRETPYDWSAARRLLDRGVNVREVEAGLARISRSQFLRGKVPGWRLGTRFTALMATWALDHFEAIAAGRYDDRRRGKYSTMPPPLRPLLFPDGSPVTVGRIDEYVRGLRARAA